MLSERKYCYCHPSSEDKHSPVSTMASEVLGEWPKQPPPQHNCPVPDVSEKLANLSLVDPELPEGAASYTAHKRPSIIENAISMLSNLFGIPPRNGTKLDMEPSSHCLAEKEQYLKQAFIPSTPCIPIFETNRNGKGQLTVPLDYGSTVEDISMTPAGVYVEEMASSECSTMRQGRVRKRRKELSKAKQHAHMGREASGKGCDKNRKEKQRHALRRDILSDNRALSFDDCYGYDYREAVPSKPVDIHPLPQRCLAAGFSPASTGSVGSFQDALQDLAAVDNEQLVTASASATVCPVSPRCKPSQSVPDCQENQQKCDMEPKPAGYVVFTEYDVFTTPSASPARRRPRNLCEVFSYALNNLQPSADDSQPEDDEDEEELDHSDYTSDDFTEDEDGEAPILGGVDELEYDDDDDDDDDSVVFCEDYDDLNNDSNSSSGFDERKVRFNMKPVVHVMRAWDFAYRQARKGDWEMAARDRERFRKRVADLEPVLGPALQPALRDKIYAERFSGQDKYAQDLKLDVN
ncbi:uncharacterized protein LOC126562045 [Anopheles maculipalpis]|uniref:uncharacterized protein LOC126562045 n=1 Tax=Anopheles maculipalpis TaxID=1496333 RepID=UPI002159632C|nr:uncharacterized protein LOC126562045 [Anopheles maculipalpis]